MVTRKELCLLYRCSPNTLRKYMVDAGIKHNHKIMNAEFQQLKAKIGDPINYDALPKMRA
jgi:hypothetical protein